ncbi:MAG: MauE/DoxX family redox-associated membrane protein [Candidatus Kapaibacteriota bacterium]
MRRTKYFLIFCLLFRILLGIVFIYAAIGKIYEPNSFFKEIVNYRIFPDILAQIFAITIPWIELVVGLFLIFGVRLRTTSFISILLLSVFTILVLSAWARGLNINCGCFAHHIEYVDYKKVLENLLLIACGVFIFLFPEGFLSIDISTGNKVLQSKESEISK